MKLTTSKCRKDINITRGYSRDHQPDLNQVILQLISEHQAGIPLWMDALSGNSSDKQSFRQTLNAHLEQLHNGVGLSLLVADSAIYNANTLQDLGDFPWITRVPETIKGTRELILAAPGEWLVIGDTWMTWTLTDLHGLSIAKSVISESFLCRYVFTHQVLQVVSSD